MLFSEETLIVEHDFLSLTRNNGCCLIDLLGSPGRMYASLRCYIMVQRKSNETLRNIEKRIGFHTSFHSLPLFAMNVSSSFLAFSMMGLVATTRVGGGTLTMGRYKHDSVDILCSSSLQNTKYLPWQADLADDHCRFHFLNCCISAYLAPLSAPTFHHTLSGYRLQKSGY